VKKPKESSIPILKYWEIKANIRNSQKAKDKTDEAFFHNHS